MAKTHAARAASAPPSSARVAKVHLQADEAPRPS